MPTKKAASHAAAKDKEEAPADLDLRSKVAGEPATQSSKRFHIFLIDTGWNVGVSKMVRTHLPQIYEYESQDTLYILTPAQSLEILKTAPEYIGHDPSFVVYDLYAPNDETKGNYRGFRLHLGRFRNPEAALTRLQEFVRFLNIHRTAICLESEVRKELHREGFQGAIKILRETLGSAPELL